MNGITMLVCFNKGDDIQYHVFENCKDRTYFVFDSIFKAFMSKGYTWSAIPFESAYAYACGFTITECDKGADEIL